MFAKATFRSLTKEAQSYRINFDVFWKGSWKNSINCDGVYVFFKYKKANDFGYHSASFHTASEGSFDYSNKCPENCSFTPQTVDVGIYVPNTALGMFLYPTTSCENADIIVDNLSVLVEMEDEPENIEIFITEMVYIPEEQHFVGDPENGISKGGTLKNCFYTYPNQGAYLISSESEIAFGPTTGQLYCDFDTPNSRENTDSFIIPATFPKGFQAMWYMKYNLTEEQFVQFLNCLTRKQQQSHVMADISNDHIEQYYAVTGTTEPKDRCDVICMRTGNGTQEPVTFYSAAPQRAMNAISYNDVSAFACFAGLRPITELEYEKAARGPLPAIAKEFAWGTTNIGRVFHFNGVDGSGTEKPLPQKKGAICNCNYGTDIAPFDKDKKTVPDNPGWVGPVSVGLYENGPVLPGFTKRECTGASYYGVMDLCGNVWENIISVGRLEGRSYLPEHGKGYLDADGHHIMKEWPDSHTAIGCGVRGGVFVSPDPSYVHMALRVFGAHTKGDKRYHGGIRVGF
jgi:formylglycine-generating enzyme required for sulfatase activity